MIVNPFLEKINHAHKLGLELVSTEKTSVVLKLPFSDSIVGNCFNKQIHGGAITTLADTACGAAIFQVQQNYRAMATLDLRVDHMKPAESGCDVYAHADCHHITHTIAFTRVTLYTDDINKPIATAVATFMRSNDDFPTE